MVYPPGKSAGFEPQDRVVSVLDLEFCGGPPGMGAGCRRFQPAAGVGGVSARGGRFSGILYPSSFREHGAQRSAVSGFTTLSVCS